tara:strand:- start:446 stop:643 length:198 start_codon:yes stop_codon:yes gene_type:complete
MKLNIDLDKDLTGVSNTELAEYLIALTIAVKDSVNSQQYTLMSSLIGYKIDVEAKLNERLKKNLG